MTSGLSNKQAAEQLHLSVYTVQVPLSRAYAKLGVRSGTQLARRLGAPDSPRPACRARGQDFPVKVPRFR